VYRQPGIHRTGWIWRCTASTALRTRFRLRLRTRKSSLGRPIPAKLTRHESSRPAAVYPMSPRCWLSSMTLESQWPTATSQCLISMPRTWQSKSRSMSTLWRRSLGGRSPRRPGPPGKRCWRLADIRVWSSPGAKRWVLAFAKKVCTEPNTQALIAIGSIVRATSTAQDADLVYIYRSERPEVGDHPLDVDVRIYDGGEVPGLIAAGHDLLGWALRYGRLICEHDRYWTHLQLRWLNGPPLPDPAIAERRASKAEAFHRELRRLGDPEAAHEQLISALTHKAWAKLIHAGVYPASRPELPAQLRRIGDHSLAAKLTSALRDRQVDVTEAARQHASAAGASRRR